MKDDDLKILIGIQLRVIMCRNLAAATEDRAVARRIYAFADEIERRARDADRELCAPNPK
jgi:hypothetical protein